MLTNSNLEAVHRRSKRGVPATTSPRCSGQESTTGTTPDTTPAAAVTGTGGAAADAVSDIVGTTAAVNKSSRHSERTAVFDAATSTTAINAISSALSQPNATSSGHRQLSINSGGAAAAAVSGTVAAAATVNTSSRRSEHNQASINSGRNLDIHDIASIPVPSIQDTDNISEYISSEDDSSMYSMSIKKKTTSKNQRKNKAAKKDTQSSPRRIAAATSLVNLTVGCLETGANEHHGTAAVGDLVLPGAIEEVIHKTIEEVIDEMFSPLRGLADDNDDFAFARKDPPEYQVEGVAAVPTTYGSDTDDEVDKEDSDTKFSGNKVGGVMSTNMQARLILRRFLSKQASLTSPPSLFAKTTDKGRSYFSASDEDNNYPEDDPTEGLYDDDELF